MKKFLLAGVLALVPAAVSAGNLDNPWERPPVAEPPAASISWGGTYLGFGATTREVITDRYDPNGFERTCDRVSTGHSAQKCQVSEYDWENSPEIQALRDVRSPWNHSDLRNDGVAGEIVRYDNAGYPGIWLNDQLSFSYTTDRDEDPTRSRGAELSSATQLFEHFQDEDREAAVNAFVGYRHMFGTSGLAGGIELGTVGGLEGQLAMSQGRWFNYVGANTDSEVTLGADRLMGDSGNWFLGGKAASSGRFEARIGLQF